MLNDYQTRKSASDSSDAEVIQARLADISKQIANIIGAIASGFSQPEFRQKMTELEEQKATCELQLGELSMPEERPAITEATLRRLLSMFRQFVVEQNIPECKKFIQSFVDKVVVFHDHVEVVLRVSTTPGGDGGLTIRSEEAVKEIRGKFRVA
jgi:site-specific DNA recombinase